MAKPHAKRIRFCNYIPLWLFLLLFSCSAKEILPDDSDIAFFNHQILTIIEENGDLGEGYILSEIMEEIYLWNKDMTIPTPEEIELHSPQELLEIMKSEEDRFSYAIPLSMAPISAFDYNHRDLSFGFQFTRNEQNEFIVTSLCNEPFSQETGIQRGFRIIEINGKNPGDWIEEDPQDLRDYMVNEVLLEGVMEDHRGQTFPVTITKRFHQMEYIQKAQLFELPHERKAAYFVLTSFRNTGEYNLIQFLKRLKQQGISELIIDLRGNTGGEMTMMYSLLNCLTGDQFIGQPYAIGKYNRQNSKMNYRRVFHQQPNRLNLHRIVFLTSSDTASASEILINDLSPFTNTVIIGEQTLGKSELMYPVIIEDQAYYIITAREYNKNRERVPAEGLVPDIYIEDNGRYDFGDWEDPVMQAAREYLEEHPLPRPAT